MILRPFVEDAKTVCRGNMLLTFPSPFLTLALPFQAQLKSYLLHWACTIKPQTTIMFLVITLTIDHLFCACHCANNVNCIVTFYSQMMNESNKQFLYFIEEETGFKGLVWDYIAGKFKSLDFYIWIAHFVLLLHYFFEIPSENYCRSWALYL